MTSFAESLVVITAEPVDPKYKECLTFEVPCVECVVFDVLAMVGEYYACSLSGNSTIFYGNICFSGRFSSTVTDNHANDSGDTPVVISSNTSI